MRLAFLGSPDVVVPVLHQLVEAGHDVKMVITRADKKRGRGSAVSPSPVSAAAQEMGLAVTSSLDALDGAEIDHAVVAAYGRLIPARLLARHTFLNIHPSLLPRWRGAAPVQRTILSGDERTGVCLMKLVEEMDAGPVYRRHETNIGRNETSDELMRRLFAMGAQMLTDSLASGLGPPQEQVGAVTHAAKLTVEDRRLDWRGSAAMAERVVRVGRAWATQGDKRLLVHEARAHEEGPPAEPGEVVGTSVAMGEGSLELITVQPEGRARMAATDWARGVRGGLRLRID